MASPITVVVISQAPSRRNSRKMGEWCRPAPSSTQPLVSPTNLTVCRSSSQYLDWWRWQQLATTPSRGRSAGASKQWRYRNGSVGSTPQAVPPCVVWGGGVGRVVVGKVAASNGHHHRKNTLQRSSQVWGLSNGINGSNNKHYHNNEQHQHVPRSTTK